METNPTINWLIHLNTQDESKVQNLTNKITEKLGISASQIQNFKKERYFKDKNWRISFTISSVPEKSWSEVVVEALRLAQKLAYCWKLTGSVDYNLEGIAHQEDFCLSGVLWINFSLSLQDCSSDCHPVPCCICGQLACDDPRCDTHPDIWELGVLDNRLACSEKCYFLANGWDYENPQTTPSSPS